MILLMIIHDENKAKIFTPKNIKKMEYMFLLSDGKYVLGVLKQG